MGQSFYLRKIPKMRAHNLLQIHMCNHKSDKKKVFEVNFDHFFHLIRIKSSYSHKLQNHIFGRKRRCMAVHCNRTHNSFHIFRSQLQT